MALTLNPGVTIVPEGDAPATVIAAPNKVKIRKLVLVAAGVASLATVTDGGDRVIAMLAAPIGSSDEIDWNTDSFSCTGLKVSVLSGTGARLFLYGG